MHPLTIATFTISGTILFVSSAFMAAGTPLPFFDTEEEELEFELTGSTGILTLDNSSTNSGWSVYAFGEYLDDDQNGLWDGCESIFITLKNESQSNSEDIETNFYYPLCEKGYERSNVDNMAYIGHLCYNPTNSTSPQCSIGNFTFESTEFVGLLPESLEEDARQGIVDWLISGLASGRTFFCGSWILMGIAILSGTLLKDEDKPVEIVSEGGAEWRAYSLAGTERGKDGMAKAFSRHKGTRDLYSKPRKGNTRGGVHKTGGLYLDGWTEADSDAEYKKKVKDRRD
ncbi:MAG: hypothetical protein CMB61_04935 [Euryarchaeota archaeon]|nr:hypothetical protein [Euryarchaeota archaeon]|tara:strand:+ start:860 stop:1717 length:858 start_codon:yes stop_codon:yes gene_type:complete